MDTTINDKREFDVNNWNTKFSIVKDGNCISIKSETFVHPAVYFYVGDNFTIVDINLENLVNELKKHGVWLTPNPKFVEYIDYTHGSCASELKSELHIKYRKRNFETPYKEIFYVNNYKEISIKDNFMQITEHRMPRKNILFAKPLIEKWISDLNNYLNERIAKGGRIMPHITGGLDSRFLTYFWRNKDVDGVYCKTTKSWTFHTFDGDIGKQVIDKIKPNLPIYQEKFVKKKIRIDLDGKHSNPFRENGNLNKEMYIYDFVNIFDADRMLDSSNVFAFLNNDLLSISTQGTPNLLHTILLKLYCPDLLDIPFHSRIWQTGVYTFSQLPVREADDILRQWN